MSVLLAHCTALHRVITPSTYRQSGQSQAALFEIKHSSQKLEDVLKEVNKVYSKELCQVIRAMLRCESALSLSFLPSPSPYPYLPCRVPCVLRAV